ncbi:hypothetical protein N9X14_00565 [bacterium]|nr:hypothetical protein [bacterium]
MFSKLFDSLLTKIIEYPMISLFINSIIVFAFIFVTTKNLDTAFEPILYSIFFSIVIILVGALWTFLVSKFRILMFLKTGKLKDKDLWKDWFDKTKQRVLWLSLFIINFAFFGYLLENFDKLYVLARKHLF